MAYAQTNYSNILGVNGIYTIKQIGCFLTAFCNLSARFGTPIDPATLNSYFIVHNSYLYAPEDSSGSTKVYDDLAWSSISAYDTTISVEASGTGTPTSDNSIVKFEYNSYQTGNPTTHFCLVNSVSNGTIVDSWDGQVKSWSVYGGPKAWASYKKTIQGGSNVVLTSDDVTALYQNILGRAPDAGGLANYTGKTLAFTLADMMKSSEYKAKISNPYTAEISDLQKTVATLNTQLASTTATAASDEQVKGGKLVEALKEALQ